MAARAAKVCGAGGGGCVIVLIEKGSRQRVEARDSASTAVSR